MILTEEDIGCKIYSTIFGWGEITKIDNFNLVLIKNAVGDINKYTRDGKWIGAGSEMYEQCLFWDVPQEPKRPARRISKKGVANISKPSGITRYSRIAFIFDSADIADYDPMDRVARVEMRWEESE
jgi:hypothetical protein